MAYLNLKHTNNAQTTLAAWISIASTSMTCTTWEGARFPSTFPFYLTLEQLNSWSTLEFKPVVLREIVKVTNRVWDVFTIARASQSCLNSDTDTTPSATAHAFNAWDLISLRVTAGDITDIKAHIDEDTILRTWANTLAWNLLPDADSTRNIWSNAVRFANWYFDNVYGDATNMTWTFPLSRNETLGQTMTVWDAFELLNISWTDKILRAKTLESFTWTSLWGTYSRCSIAYDTDNNKACIVYDWPSAHIHLVIWTISNDVLTLWTPVDVSTDFMASSDICYVWSWKFVVVYKNNADSYAKSFVVSVSWTVPSIWAIATINSAVSQYITCDYDTVNTKVLVSYQNQWISSRWECKIWTVSWTSISWWSAFVYDANTTLFNVLKYNSVKSNFFISYQDNTSLILESVCATISGANVNYGTAVTFDTATDSAWHLNIAMMNSWNVYIAFADKSNSYYLTGVIASISWTTITYSINFVLDTTWTTTYITMVEYMKTWKIIINHKIGSLVYRKVVVNWKVLDTWLMSTATDIDWSAWLHQWSKIANCNWRALTCYISTNLYLILDSTWACSPTWVLWTSWILDDSKECKYMWAISWVFTSRTPWSIAYIQLNWSISDVPTKYPIWYFISTTELLVHNQITKWVL